MINRKILPILLLLLTGMPINVAQANLSDLLKMSERMDQMELQEIGEYNSEIEACLARDDFECASAQLAKARKIASTGDAKQRIAKAENYIRMAEAAYQERERQRAEAEKIAQLRLQELERKIAEEEARIQQDYEAAKRQAEEEDEEDEDEEDADGDMSNDQSAQIVQRMQWFLQGGDQAALNLLKENNRFINETNKSMQQAQHKKQLDAQRQREIQRQRLEDSRKRADVSRKNIEQMKQQQLQQLEQTRKQQVAMLAKAEADQKAKLQTKVEAEQKAKERAAQEERNRQAEAKLEQQTQRKSEAYCWKTKPNEKVYWWCYGPIQRMWAGEDTLEKPLRLVGCHGYQQENKDIGIGIKYGAWFTCHDRLLQPQDDSPEKIRRWISQQ
jgi:hypothetical protein